MKITGNLLRGLLLLLLALPFSGQAADFTLGDIYGNTHRLADYRGKWVLVNFWAIWCPSCLNEIPELNGLHEAHKNSDLVVIGIAMDSGSAKSVANFARDHGIKYPIVLGSNETRQQLDKVEALPTSYLYSPEGKLVSHQQGEVTRESVETYIKSKDLTSRSK